MFHLNIYKIWYSTELNAEISFNLYLMKITLSEKDIVYELVPAEKIIYFVQQKDFIPTLKT